MRSSCEIVKETGLLGLGFEKQLERITCNPFYFSKKEFEFIPQVLEGRQVWGLLAPEGSTEKITLFAKSRDQISKAARSYDRQLIDGCRISTKDVDLLMSIPEVKPRKRD
jgi:hypothetical protein